MFSAIVKLPQPTRTKVQATELRPDDLVEGVQEPVVEHPTAEDVTLVTSTATRIQPKPTRAHVQAVVVPRDDEEGVSEGLKPAVADVAQTKDVGEDEAAEPGVAVAGRPVPTEV